MTISLWLVATGGIVLPPAIRAEVPSDSLTLTISITDTFAPAAITDLVGISGGSEGQVALSWTAPQENGGMAPSNTPAVSYTVRFATQSADTVGSTTTWWNTAFDVNSEPAPQVPGSSELFLIPDALEPGATLWFAIKATDDGANTSDVDSKTLTPTQAFAVVPDMPPPAPANMSGSTGNGQVMLSWDPVAVADFDYYRVYVDSTAPYGDSYFLVAQTASTGFTHNSLTNGNRYDYYATAVDKGAPTYLGNALESAPSTVISAVPSGSVPVAPTLAGNLANTTTTQIRWNVTDNDLNEVGMYVVQLPITDLSPNLGPNALTGTVRTFDDGGHLPNTRVDRYARSVNGVSVSSASAIVTMYTRANPPLNTQVTSVSSNTITLGWGTNFNDPATLYEIEYDVNAGFSTAVAAGATTANGFTVVGLTANSNYFLRVRARNGQGVVTTYDVSVSTRTNKKKDNTPPSAPTGIWAEWSDRAQGKLRLHWRSVGESLDGTPFDDPATERYKAYRSLNFVVDPATPAEKIWTTDGVSSEDTLSPNQTYYYRFRARDNADNESPDSMIIEANMTNGTINVLATADDLRSRISVPVDVARFLLLKESNGLNQDVIIRATQVASEESGRVVSSVRFEAFRGNQQVKDFVIKPAEGTIMIGYEVQNGQVVQGVPSPVNQVSGAPVFEAVKADQQLALFWHNGVEWVKVGGNVSTDTQTVSIKTSRLGRYQVRQAIRVGPASLTRVYPQIFTPNNDTWNDKVVFEFDNPALLPLKGEVFDVSGAKVADLAVGPNPDSSLIWDGMRGGQAVPSGVYIYEIEVGGETVTGTVVVAQ